MVKERKAGKALTREEILAATELVLRRFGPAKASVVDVARALGVTHGTVYRHFPSKAALREAVTRRWIEHTHEGVLKRADDPALPAPDRLAHWLNVVCSAKQAIARADPELFSTYFALVQDHSDVVGEHIADLLGHIEAIIRDGIAGGQFAAGDPAALARAVFDATSRFHHPAHASEWGTPRSQAELDQIVALILRGLAA